MKYKIIIFLFLLNTNNLITAQVTFSPIVVDRVNCNNNYSSNACINISDLDDYLIAIESITEESGNLELFALGLSNFDELTLVGDFIDYKLYYISSDLATIDILYGILAANYIVGNSKNINLNYRISRYTGAYYDYILTNVRFGASQTFGSTITVSNPNYPVSGPSVVCTSASSYTISELLLALVLLGQKALI